MESNTINRVLLSGRLAKRQIENIPIGIGDERKMVTMVRGLIEQKDPRKKVSDESRKVNMFIVKAVGVAAEKMTLIPLGAYILIKGGMIQTRIDKKAEESLHNLKYQIFLPYDADENNVDEYDGSLPVLNEITLAGKIFQNDVIKTVVHRREDSPDYAQVSFALQVGRLKESENPDASTRPANICFCKYKPKNIEGFEEIEHRFSSTGKFVSLTGALISEVVNQQYRLQVIIRQLIIAPDRVIKIQEMEVEGVSN